MQLSTLTDRFLNYLPRFIDALPVVGVIVVGALILNVVLGRAMVLVARRTHLKDVDVLPVRHLLAWLVRIVAVILILSVFGFQIGGIWAMLSTLFGLVAIGFVAVWSVLSHTSATMLILFLHPFQVGDDLEFPGEPIKGRVTDLNFFFTTIIDHDGALHQIPNNLFFQKTLKRRKNSPSISLAAQLNSSQAAEVELPPLYLDKPASGTVQEPDPMMRFPDPRSIAPPGKIAR